MCVETAWQAGQAASQAVASALIVSILSEVSKALIRNPDSSKGMQFKVLQLVWETRGFSWTIQQILPHHALLFHLFAPKLTENHNLLKHRLLMLSSIFQI